MRSSLIDLGYASATDAPALRCSRALIERFTSAPVETPATASALEWVETLTQHLAAADVCAVVEHLFGVLPLLDFFDGAEPELAAITSGSKLGALGLCMPTPEDGWGAAVLVGERSGGAVRLSGELRLPSHVGDGSMVLVRLAGADQRLAWLDHDTPGVERRASQTDTSLRGNSSPCSLTVDGATIDAARVSRSVALAPGTELYRRLEVYAGIWALVAVDCARRAVHELRRVARTTRCHGRLEACSASQLVAVDITEVEIETELATAAARRHFTRAADSPRAAGLVLALSAARTLGAVTATARKLRDQLGLPLDNLLADEAAPTVTAYLGGVLTLENELARALDLGQPSACRTP